ncbi:MAG TPA: helix-turn-helix domain-containing protein [Paenalcaligenes sp.]|nr:helix-turn-helix domain-containing protein [Paenalcaligenes sp.]
MSKAKPRNPSPEKVRHARHAANLTQTEAARIVSASMRAWQQWEAGERAMPPGLFELFMLKTRQWPLNNKHMMDQEA